MGLEPLVVWTDISLKQFTDFLSLQYFSILGGGGSGGGFTTTFMFKIHDNIHNVHTRRYHKNVSHDEWMVIDLPYIL